MSWAVLRLLFDFGLVVLIWIIQLVVYPSFKHYNKDALLKWHKKYTGRITLVVLPLMLGQLITAAAQLWKLPSWYSVSSMIVITALWLITFTIFVPLHNKVSQGKGSEEVLSDLVKRNWLRTVLWSALFSTSVYWIISYP